jgi:hypothetical protein
MVIREEPGIIRSGCHRLKPHATGQQQPSDWIRRSVGFVASFRPSTHFFYRFRTSEIEQRTICATLRDAGGQWKWHIWLLSLYLILWRHYRLRRSISHLRVTITVSRYIIKYIKETD